MEVLKIPPHSLFAPMEMARHFDACCHGDGGREERLWPEGRSSAGMIFCVCDLDEM